MPARRSARCARPAGIPRQSAGPDESLAAARMPPAALQRLAPPAREAVRTGSQPVRRVWSFRLPRRQEARLPNQVPRGSDWARHSRAERSRQSKAMASALSQEIHWSLRHWEGPALQWAPRSRWEALGLAVLPRAATIARAR